MPLCMAGVLAGWAQRFGRTDDRAPTRGNQIPFARHALTSRGNISREQQRRSPRCFLILTRAVERGYAIDSKHAASIFPFKRKRLLCSRHGRQAARTRCGKVASEGVVVVRHGAHT